MYKFDDETISNLDNILGLIRSFDVGAYTNESELTLQMKNKYNIREIQTVEYLKILDSLKLIERERKKKFPNDRIKDYETVNIKMLVEGKKFITDGGFLGEKNRYEKEVQQQQKDKAILRELSDLKLQDLKTRFESLEKNHKEQSQFWTESAKTAKANRNYFKVSIAISILALLLAIFSYIKSI